MLAHAVPHRLADARCLASARCSCATPRRPNARPAGGFASCGHDGCSRSPTAPDRRRAAAAHFHPPAPLRRPNKLSPDRRTRWNKTQLIAEIDRLGNGYATLAGLVGRPVVLWSVLITAVVLGHSCCAAGGNLAWSFQRTSASVLCIAGGWP